MLVLSRKKDQSIRIGDDIEIMIIEVRGDKVRIGVKAPKDVTVLSHWLAAGGNRRSAAKALGLGYTNFVESLREYGVSNRLPNLQQKQEVLQCLTDLRTLIDRREVEVNLCECESG